MALIFARATLVLRSQAKQNLPTLLRNRCEGSLGATSNLVAHLTSYHGGKAERKKPWPYKKRGFRFWHLPFDRVDSRLDDNSKIIVIEGNLATGKSELGKKIANEFDLLYVPDVSDVDMYTSESGVDIREFDPQLPVKARTCDFETFYSQKGSKSLLKNVARTQYELYRYKMINYAQNVIAHVLNTGQGVVMNRGMWSDMVFAYTLRKHGYMTPAAMKAYQFQYDATTQDEWWHPHLVIYLDAPVEMIRQRIKKRNVPWEVNSPVLTDEFLHTISDTYKNKYLPYMRNWSEILTYNLAESPELDFEVVVEDLESLDLDNTPEDFEKRFSQWQNVHNRDYNEMRSICSKQKENKLWSMFNFHLPYEAPELVVDGGDGMAYKQVVSDNPRLWYNPKFQPDDSKRLWRLTG